MPKKVADSSLESMSSDALKQLLVEQTSEVVTPPEKEEVKEAETAKEIPVESTEEKVSEEQTTEETPEEELKAKTVKLKVEGKEVEIPEEKLLDYAQQGYHYNKKMEDLKKQRAELERLKEPVISATQQPPQFTTEQIREELIRRLNAEPEVTLPAMMQQAIEIDRQRSRNERKMDLQFEIEKAEGTPHWTGIKERYHFFRELGDEREMAFIKAENDYFKTLYVQAKTKGLQEGAEKSRLKQKADIPGGERKTAPSKTAEPSTEDLSKMSAGELAKMLPKVTVPDW